MIEPRHLTYRDLGNVMQVMGRDITVGQHQRPPSKITGELHSYRVVKGRMVLVLLTDIPGRLYHSPRIVEVIIP